MVRPLIHIGYHKTGSSWLQKHLFDNLDVGFVSPFSRPDMKALLVNPNALDFQREKARALLLPPILGVSKRSMTPVLSEERFSGNPHSGGYDSKEIANRLRSVIPEARVLIVIREQKGMILSTYRQYVLIGGPCSLNAYLHPPSTKRIPLFDFEHFKYHRLIALYQELFDRSNVLVLPYEMFQQQPDLFVSRITQFADARTPRDLSYSSGVNVSLSGLSIALKRHLNRFLVRDSVNPGSLINAHRLNVTIEYTFRLFDALLPRYFLSSFDRRLRERIAEVVRDRYRESNNESVLLTDLDLGSYGYDVSVEPNANL